MAQNTEEIIRQLSQPAKQARSRAQAQRIIKAGLELLQDSNFEDLFVEQIAAKAGCSVGTLYTRFKNKEALLEVLAEVVRQEIVTELESGLSQEIEKSTSLRELLEKVVAFLASVLREREMLLRAIVLRQLNTPGTIAPLQKTAVETSNVALEKAYHFQPDDLSDSEFERRFRIAFQMILGTIINMIVNRPGPIFLDSEGIERDLSAAVVGYLQSNNQA